MNNISRHRDEPVSPYTDSTRESYSVLCEAGFCYTIVKACESQKKNTCSDSSAAKTTTVQEKTSKITTGKVMMGENSTKQQQKNY